MFNFIQIAVGDNDIGQYYLLQMKRNQRPAAVTIRYQRSLTTWALRNSFSPDVRPATKTSSTYSATRLATPTPQALWRWVQLVILLANICCWQLLEMNSKSQSWWKYYCYFLRDIRFILCGVIAIGYAVSRAAAFYFLPATSILCWCMDYWTLCMLSRNVLWPVYCQQQACS